MFQNTWWKHLFIDDARASERKCLMLPIILHFTESLFKFENTEHIDKSKASIILRCKHFFPEFTEIITLLFHRYMLNFLILKNKILLNLS